ncbi:hypothetical protein DSCO28_23980 [Desulfosarcina ovata subsp. sediminis]|uniref:Uncharacterized protein n=1 Tax=Desulfosarcina ovata subsp. sediminis TaxID=885957 RepID=A0A5K7ZI88_9BACT|nr:hypothetical protein [Desulfosarcina ovata]BBO81832.1 hypothetical protein DSCO28_23980 [Desulfosarcina ovata subsp. sediminis]
MKKVVEKLRAEKASIELKKAEMQGRQSEEIEEAYRTGMRVAAKWIRGASYQEIKDVVKRPNARHDADYFSFMRSIYFTSLEKICPEESKQFKWIYNEAFLNGWREEVNNIWESIKDEVNR